MAVPLRSLYATRKSDGGYISRRILKGWREVRTIKDVYVRANNGNASEKAMGKICNCALALISCYTERSSGLNG